MKKLSFSFAVFLSIAAIAQQPPTLPAQAKAALSVIQGTTKVPGLQKPVKVMRDRWGVAHIYAENQHDLFFAQGYVVSQDRLFQMELWKRSGQGRLAEILGPQALGRDTYARLLRYRGDMDAEYASYSSDTRQILEAFTEGINAFIAERSEPGGQGLSVEFQMAGFAPEPWKPEDCLNRMAAFSMTGNIFRELQHAQMVATVGVEKATALADFDPPVKLDPAPGIDFTGLSTHVLKGLVGSDTRIEFPRKALEGSNNWTVSGKLTQTGQPLLANDPHRVIAEPSLRYMVHLVAPGWDVIGAGEPGLPGVALGHNQDIAWGFTIFGLDQQDSYLEELNPQNPLQYKTSHGWQTMQVQRETFAVRGGASVTKELKFTEHGPVLSQDSKHALALHWVGSEPGTAGYLGSLAIDRAHNWDDFEAAMPRWKVPSENIVYADKLGNIGEHSTGLAPLRDWTGLLPVPGGGAYEWSGFVRTADLPHAFNPASGFIATANNKMIPDGYAYNVGFEWYSVFRAKRVSEVLSQAPDHSLRVEDMQKLQNDVVSLPARELVGILRTAAAGSTDAATKLLLTWDFSVTRESAAAALYELWLGKLSTAVLHQIAPANTWAILEDLPVSKLVKCLSTPTTADFGPNPEARRNRIMFDALRSAASQLATLEGPDPVKWSWGQLHVVKFQHPLDQVPGAATLTDLGPASRPGDDETLDATGYEPGKFAQIEGASYREVLDTSDWDKSTAINVPGQSGQPVSPHQSDLLPLWLEGQYFPLAYSKAAVEKVTTDTLILQP